MTHLPAPGSHHHHHHHVEPYQLLGAAMLGAAVGGLLANARHPWLHACCLLGCFPAAGAVTLGFAALTGGGFVPVNILLFVATFALVAAIPSLVERAEEHARVDALVAREMAWRARYEQMMSTVAAPDEVAVIRQLWDRASLSDAEYDFAGRLYDRWWQANPPRAWWHDYSRMHAATLCTCRSDNDHVCRRGPVPTAAQITAAQQRQRRREARSEASPPAGRVRGGVERAGHAPDRARHAATRDVQRAQFAGRAATRDAATPPTT